MLPLRVFLILWRPRPLIQVFRVCECCRPGWIREGLAASIAVLDQERIEGRLIWQDPEFLALERLGSTRPVLIARRHITLIRSID